MAGRFDVGKKTPDDSPDAVLAEIGKLIGMGNIKDELNKLLAYGELLKLLREREIAAASKIGLHMVFKGPPGTGKTVLAREFGKLFKAIGLLREGRVVEVDRSMLVGTHLGESEKLTKDAFERAKNGVLFIDEAYSLAGISPDDVLKDMDDPYGKAAIDTLLKLMEDNRSSVIVIVAGYPDPMDRFLKRNLGLKSRFAKYFVFEPYTEDELVKILKSFASEWNYTLEPEAESEARKFIATWDKKAKDFGNAREVRTFFEAMLPVQAERISGIPNFRALSNEQLLTITADDVEGTVAAYGSRV